MSADRTFVDTNIIVYAYDRSAAQSTRRPERFSSIWKSGAGVISTQVIQEFFVTVTRKLPRPMEPESARKVVSDLLL